MIKRNLKAIFGQYPMIPAEEYPTPLPRMGKLNMKKLTEKEDELHTAAWINDIERISQILSLGININVQDEYGNTALLYAAALLNQEAVELLIKRGADINIGNTWGMNALEYAKKRNHKKIKKLLIS
jgi:ankyrin repeat protein